MHGMAPHMHMACKEELEDGDGEVAEGARACAYGSHTFPGDRFRYRVQPEPLGTAPGSKRPPAKGAEDVPCLKAGRHERTPKPDRK